MSDHLDVDPRRRALGDGYVLLLRGHRFHTGRGARRAARVVDVTDTPRSTT